jgi:hypothetical protein
MLPLWLALTLMLLASCMAISPLDDHPVLSVVNETDVTVEVVIEWPNGDESVVASDLAPGSSISYDRLGDCDDGQLVARDLAGVEIARSGPPVCRPSQWVIRRP